MIEDLNIIVPIGDRDEAELKLALAIFGASDMEIVDGAIIVKSAKDEIIYEACDLFTNNFVVDNKC